MRHARSLIRALLLLALSAVAFAAEMPAVVHKPSVDVHSGPDFATPKVATLSRNAKVAIAAQQGLWYQLKLDADKAGYVRVNDVRMAYAGAENPDANMRALFTGNAGKGRVSETASVRGLDESDCAPAQRRRKVEMEDIRRAATATAHAVREGFVRRRCLMQARPAVSSAGSTTNQAQSAATVRCTRLLAAWSQHRRFSATRRCGADREARSRGRLTAETGLGPEIAGA